MKPERTTSQSSTKPKPDTEMKDLPPPPEVVREKNEEEKKREVAKGDKKYVAPLPGYDDSGTSSSNTPLWSKVAAGKTDWTTVNRKPQIQQPEKE